MWTTKSIWIFVIICGAFVVSLFGVFNFLNVPLSVPEVIKEKIEIKKNTVSILNFGDVMFDRGVRNIIENKKRDPFEYIKQNKDLLEPFDLIVANLEGPIVEMVRSLCQQKAYNFQFASTTTELLRSIGINMVSIANNHAFDCFRTGFESTKTYLQNAGIEFVGDRELEKSYVLKTIKGKTFAFVGIDETTQPIPLSRFYSLIERLDKENMYVIIYVHWGTEYTPEETTNQEYIAHKFIDSGADLIVGHHPHVIQPVKVYKNKAIFYSLGNFVFDQNTKETTEGIGVGVEFEDEKTIFTIYPYVIKLFAPDFLEGESKNLFCSKYLEQFLYKDCSFEI